MRGSVDGFNGKTFLDKCCYKGKTLTIVKDYDERIFGAFTDINIDGNRTWYKG